MKLTQLLHASILVMDVPTARAFYEGVLGLSPSPSRPDLNFPGVWYDFGAQQIHLIALANAPQAINHEHGGRDRHIALAVDNIEELKSGLEQAGILFTMSRSGRAALFCRDPDGNALEFVQT